MGLAIYSPFVLKKEGKTILSSGMFDFCEVKCTRVSYVPAYNGGYSLYTIIACPYPNAKHLIGTEGGIVELAHEIAKSLNFPRHLIPEVSGNEEINPEWRYSRSDYENGRTRVNPKINWNSSYL